MTTPAEAMRVAERALTERFADADAGFAAGSIFRGEGAVASDIDLVVLYPHLSNARRESFVLDGVPVEAFVHDSETLAWFLAGDRDRGRPALLAMVAEGRIFGPKTGAAADFQVKARRMLIEGPAPLSKAQLEQLRYDITDKIDDLRGRRSRAEITALGAALYASLAELLLRGRGRWFGSGKWIPRLLRDLDVAMATRFDTAFEALFARGEAAQLIGFVEEALRPFGGLLFDGDQRAAPPSSRVTASTAARRDAAGREAAMSSYAGKIRAKIGAELLFLQAASVLAFDDDGRVLLGQGRNGMWATIGGAIEPGESPADAAVREFWEEAGALVSIVRVLGVFFGPEFFVTYPDGNQVAYTAIAFEARIISGEVKPDNVELGKLAWFTAEEAERLPMTPPNRIVTQLAMAGRDKPVHQEPRWRP